MSTGDRNQSSVAGPPGLVTNRVLPGGTEYPTTMTSTNGAQLATRAEAGPSLLLIDDDVELCGLMQEYFDGQGIELDTALDGQRGLGRALDGRYDLILLDVMLPALEGFEVLRQIRRRSVVPIIMLTARASRDDRIAGLDAGADDYLPKPFDPEELIARIRAVLRRSNRAGALVNEIVEAGPLKLTPASHESWIDDARLELTTIEFEILLILARSAGRIISRGELTAAIHQRPASPLERSLDVHVSHLRRKLGELGALIRTIRGVGYLFQPQAVQGDETSE